MTYDLVAIGSGWAGGSAALRCAGKGWKVAVIDRQPFGGTCALRGCNPKKALVSVSHAHALFRRLKGLGIEGKAAVNWGDLFAFKKDFVRDIPRRNEQQYREAGIDRFHGTASFTGPETLTVNDTELTSRFFLIGSGAGPRQLGIMGEEHLMTSDDFLKGNGKPDRIVFIGGGYIAFEFSQIAAEAGIEVTILQRDPHLLKPFEPDLVARLAGYMQKANIRILTDVEVTEIKPGPVVVTRSHGEFPADWAVNSAGRIPLVKDLDLDRAGVQTGKQGVVVNRYLQTDNPRIYAAGDCCAAGVPLTPSARLQYYIATSNMLEGNQHIWTEPFIPSVAFTDPPIAMVGLTEARARGKNRRIQVIQADSSDWPTHRRVGISTGGYKIIIDPDTKKILGAHLLGHHAQEVINLFALAMRCGLTYPELRHLPLAYPTAASDIASMKS